jgi:hypothetical protein
LKKESDKNNQSETLCVAIIMNKKTTLHIALDAIIPACNVTNYKLQEQ